MSVSRKVSDYVEIQNAIYWLREMLNKGLRGGPAVITIGREKRSLDANAKLWPMLEDVARQCLLVINGEKVKASKEDWKVIFTSSLCSQTRVAMGIDGGVVFLGESTSKMSKQKFSDLIEVIYEYGANNDVQWSEKAAAAYEEYKEAQR